MIPHRHYLNLSALGCTLAVLMFTSTAFSAAETDPKTTASKVLDTTTHKGGIAVHLGCADGRLIAELVRQSKFYVHGLDADPDHVERARSFLQAQNLYTRSAVERSSFKTLPYAEHLINLIVVDDLPRLLQQGLAIQEVVRVLVPNGVALFGKTTLSDFKAKGLDGIQKAGTVTESGEWIRFQKKRPPEMDDWSHARHAPDGNFVSRDMVVGPPEQLQWIAPPMWGHHKGPGGVVSAGGRLFYVLLHNQLRLASGGRYYLSARDAFNGRLLWQKQVKAPIASWSHKSSFSVGALAASPDRLYVVLEAGHPLKALDAATGEELMSYDAHPSPSYVIHTGKLLLLVLGKKSYSRIKAGAVHAVDKASGKLLWKRSGLEFGGNNPLVVGKETVFFRLSGGSRKPPHRLIAADLKTGEEKWVKKVSDLFPNSVKGFFNLCAYYKQTLLVTNVIPVHFKGKSRGKYTPWTLPMATFAGHIHLRISLLKSMGCRTVYGSIRKEGGRSWT